MSTQDPSAPPLVGTRVVEGEGVGEHYTLEDVAVSEGLEIEEVAPEEVGDRILQVEEPEGAAEAERVARLAVHRVAARRALSGRYRGSRYSWQLELRVDVDGYAFPMQFWVQAVANGLRIREIPVKLIYNDLNRSFGGPLDDPANRIGHYRRVLHREIGRCADRLPDRAADGLGCVGNRCTG